MRKLMMASIVATIVVVRRNVHVRELRRCCGGSCVRGVQVRDGVGALDSGARKRDRGEVLVGGAEGLEAREE